MERKKQLLDLVNNDIKYIMLIDDILYLEEELTRLRKLDKIKVKGDLQKITQAGKLYKDLLQQYINAIKVIAKVNDSDSESVSPLREWLKEHS